VNRRPIEIRAIATIVAAIAAIPPLAGIFTGQMLTHMLVQIPLIFACAVMWGASVRLHANVPWLSWNLQGAPGLLLSAFVLTYWMTPIALDHAAADWGWDFAKVLSLVLAGVAAGISWRLGSVVTQLFYAGNMLWMMITAGILYQDADQRLCNAYLWDDQVKTGQGLVALSVLCACVVLVVAARAGQRHSPPSAVKDNIPA
jgi:hypothetical protein